MNTYQTLQQKILGLAFILGPLLLMIGSAAYVLGIGLTPFGTDSWVDAIFITYSGLVMIPVYFELARILGQRTPIFGMICAVAGLSWGLFGVPATLKLIQIDIINAGLNESVWAISPSYGGWTPIFVGVALLHLTPLLFGIGFLWTGGIPRWAAGLLIAGAIFLVIGVGGGEDIAWWQTSIFAPLSTLAFLVALAPIGLRYLAGDSEAYEFDMATA
jgi:hypothetical protein